ncbi:hypothetical protein WJX72_001915 [[Myrmecia] bisecta]|uniref:CDP-diacylglycerol--glycerol-3-phosphate 3-phosphatidyltransferase n=1 Tax=[Myrmecia] bisecta TaxID=41462 RepID=A0AAW1QB15_9CHLO
MSGFIPTAYSLLEHSTWVRLCRAWAARGASEGGTTRELLEYERPGWEFHAKGIWYTPAGEKWPIATAIGSPNYGYRSLHRDLEAQLIIVTVNPRLRQAMAGEVAALTAHAQQVDEQRFLGPGRRASRAARLAVRMLRSFL